MKPRTILLTIVLALTANSVLAYSGPAHVSGNIANLTSTTQGLMLKVGSLEVPQNCTSGNTWMLIAKEDATMISVAITAWTLGKNVVVYTAAASTGYCKIIQVDPGED